MHDDDYRSPLQRVTGYTRMPIRGPITSTVYLCDRCAETTEIALGPVQHGAHRGVCEGCDRDLSPMGRGALQTLRRALDRVGCGMTVDDLQGHR